MTGQARGDLTLGLGYRIRYFDYFDFTVNIQDIIDSPLGLDLTDPYVLSMLYQRLTWDDRNNKLSPSRGWYGSIALAEAGGPVSGNFNFIRTQTEIRGYRSLRSISRWNPKFVVAARIGGGIITPYGTGEKENVPYAERLYLGGGTTVRGWGANRLGPSVATTDADTGATVLVPAGGLFDTFGNLELRQPVGLGFGVAAFTDVGRVWPTVSDFSFGGLQWSVGGGIRYATVIGPIRGDVGVRLGPDTPDLPRLPRWALHFGLSEAF
jgi:outer membrane protein assembly factor BamA